MKNYLIGIYDLKDSYFVNYAVVKDLRQFVREYKAGLKVASEAIKQIMSDCQIYVIQELEDDSTCSGQILVSNEEILNIVMEKEKE